MALGWVPILVGALTLLGWQTDSYGLKRIIDSPIPVNPATSVLFIMLGLAILRPSFTRIAAPVIGLMAALKCCDLFFGTEFHIDAYLFANDLAYEPAFPNRMAPTTTLNFLFLALALALRPGMARRLFLLLTIIISLYTLTAYAFGDGSFRGIGMFTPMALITAITFLAAACGLWVGGKR